jgi:hypothetical protein
MYLVQPRIPPRELFDSLFIVCLIAGIITGIIFGFKLYNSIVSSLNT